MGLILIILLLSLQNSVFAENKNTIHILTSKDYPTQKLNSKKFTINKKSKKDVIDPQRRDLYFEQCDLIKMTSHLDHVDKDILVLRVKSLSLIQLEKKYPEMEKKHLVCLKSKVKKD